MTVSLIFLDTFRATVFWERNMTGCSDTQIFAKKHFFSLRRKFETTVRHRELPGDDLIEIFTSDTNYFEPPSFNEFLYNKDHLK